MDEIAALLVAGAAVAVVLIATKRQEAQTAVQVQKITNSKNSATLGASDIGAAAATTAGFYFGGPAGGAAAAHATGFRL